MPRTSRLSLIALVFGSALFYIIFLANTDPSQFASLRTIRYRYPPRLSLEDEIVLTEIFYQNTLPERSALIRKFGPTVDKIESCVPGSVSGLL